jgi:hypothetical protein
VKPQLDLTIVLSVETANGSPADQVKTPSHSTEQTDDISLAGAGEWPGHRAMTTTKQTATNRPQDSIVSLATPQKLRAMQKYDARL